MSTTENPKVTIIIPCYNVGKYISQCLESLLSQTYQNIEIICINDGSKDDTLSLLQLHSQKDSRVRVFSQINLGLSKTRTLGMRYSTGAYTMFVDGDDWIERNCIEVLMEKKADFDIICFSYFREFKNLTIPKRFYLEGVFPASFLQRMIIGPLAEEKYNIDGIDALVTVWGKLYKSEKLTGIDFVEVDEIGTWEDGLFNLEVLENCENALVINQPYYHYRRDNESSFTSLAKKDLQIKWLHKFNLISTLIQNKSNDYQQALQNRIAISVLGLSLTEMNTTGSLITKNRKIDMILSQPVYSEALKQFVISDLPLQWRLFYGLAKKKWSIGIVFLTKLIQIIQKVKNF